MSTCYLHPAKTPAVITSAARPVRGLHPVARNRQQRACILLARKIPLSAQAPAFRFQSSKAADRRRNVARHILCSSKPEAAAMRDQDDVDKPEPGEDQPQMSASEQLRVQTELAREEEYKRTAAPPGKTRQLLIVMRHGERIDEVDKSWSAIAKRPFDPFLSDHGQDQAKKVAAKLKKYDIKKVYISPFFRCLQTASFAAEGLGIQPQDWTVTCAVGEFMNPKLMVKKGGKCPPGDINTWFFEGDGLKDHVHKKLPSTTASKMQVGRPNFGQYPENLLISRRRFSKAFQAIAEEANGDNVLIVTHGDGVNASVTRIWPWALSHPVLHTGFTVAARDKEQDGMWGPWKMISKKGESGVWWRAELQPAYHVFKGAQGVVQGAAGGVGSLFNKLKR
ncbi:TPA: hypothetical protein ACH3X2_001262 [Trebouxia sp. C0005]